jgi:hydrogenase-4 membrane subunit HyfE
LGGEDCLLKYIDFLSRLIMVSSFLIIGFKLSKETIAISALLVGIILQIIYRKMKKDENFSQEENLK